MNIIFKYFIFFMSVYSNQVYGQSNRIYHIKFIKDSILNNCLIINNDTVNCMNSNKVKNGKWINYRQGLHYHSDFGKYIYYDSYESIISVGNYKNNVKDGLWIYYTNENFKDQKIERIVNIKNGKKDSIETIYTPGTEYRTEIYRSNDKIDSLKIFNKNELKLKYFGIDIWNFKEIIFYENERIKFKILSENSEYFLSTNDSLGQKKEKIKRDLEFIIPNPYYSILINGI